MVFVFFWGTDCHVAALLAMTVGRGTDCHVAALLAMTKRNDTVCRDDTENAQ